MDGIPTESGRVFGWSPPAESSRFVPDEALADMKNGEFKPARTSGWFVVGSVPVRITVVDPHASRTFRKVKADKWISVARKTVETIDCLSGEKALRPASVDVTVYLWKGKKTLPWADCPVSPRNANTGVTSRNLATGESAILVYREEESVKTLIHEMLHAFRFGDWANDDEEMHRGCESLVAANGIRMSTEEDLKPTEALVDAMAVRLAAYLFGGRSWSDCLSYAERLSERLVERCGRAGGGVWKQTTGAFEYYCVKPVFMRGMNELLAAHAYGLQNPDKPKVRSILRSFGPASRGRQEYSALRRRLKATEPKTVCLRMTPHRLAPSP